MNRKIVVLGCGYIGYNLAEYLSDQTFDVTIVGYKNEYSSNLSTSINFINHDILTYLSINKKSLCDSIFINCIGNINATNNLNKSDLVIKENFVLITNIIKLLNEIRNSKLIQISSGGTVYGEAYNNLLSEKCQENPINLYGLEKLFYEKYLYINFMENKKLPYIILRLSNPYGGYQLLNKSQGIIPVLIKKCILNEELELWTNLSTTRDYVFIGDFQDCVTKLIINDNCWCNIYNIGTGKGTSIKQLIAIVERLTNVQIKTIYKESTTINIKNNVLNNKKIIDDIELNFTSLEDGIKREIDRIENQLLK